MLSDHVLLRQRLSSLEAKVAITSDDTASARSSTATTGVGRGENEEKFEQWAEQSGIKAPKLQHTLFADPLVGDLRYEKRTARTF